FDRLPSVLAQTVRKGGYWGRMAAHAAPCDSDSARRAFVISARIRSYLVSPPCAEPAVGTAAHVSSRGRERARNHLPCASISRTSLDHFCAPPRIVRLRSSGPPPTISPPSPRNRCCTSGICTVLTSSACSLATMGLGVRAGTTMPYQLAAS